MVDAPAEAPTGRFLKNEPVIAAHIAAWVVLNLGVLLVSRYHVFTPAQWSVAAVELTGMITAGVLFLMGWLIRRAVAPAWKLATLEAGRIGVILPDIFATLTPTSPTTAYATGSGGTVTQAPYMGGGQPPTGADDIPDGKYDPAAPAVEIPPL